MILKRSSPNLTCLIGRVGFGEANSFVSGAIVPSERTKKQALIYVQPSHHKRRTPFLEKAKELITDALNNPFDYDLGHIFWHRDKPNKNGVYRKVRSEQRESMTLRVGRFIMHHVHVASLSLGHFVKELNDFHYYDYTYIAKTIGINLSQVKRTMARFIKAGYVSVEQRKKKRLDGSYSSLAPIIRINIRLFYDLGIDKNIIKFHVERFTKRFDKEKNKAGRDKEQKPPLFEPPSSSNSKAQQKAMAEIRKALAGLTDKFKINSS
jgi:hypothetical protein